jgi:catechol 2,3-dioxygenase-like lactoylglutathione lyase family enzyme
MTVRLNHTIVAAHDKQASASFLAEILGLPQPKPFGPFLTVQVDNDVTLDFMDWGEVIAPQHYAFLVGEWDFDVIFGRIRERDLPFWADPHQHEPGAVNTADGGRGVYFEDPSGHLLETLTRPYGSGGG